MSINQIPGFQWTPYELEIIEKNKEKFNKLTKFSQVLKLGDKLVCPDPAMDGEDYDDETEFALRPIILTLALKFYGPDGIYFQIYPRPNIGAKTSKYPRKYPRKPRISISIYVSIRVQPGEEEISWDIIPILNNELTLEEIMDETIFRKFFIDWLNNQIHGGQGIDDLINVDKICLYLLENYLIKMVIENP